MQRLIYQRCFNHAGREAVARCPECAHYFCRECITEHQERAVCAACLERLVRLPQNRRPALAGLLHLGQCLLGVIFLWVFFYLLGLGLLSIPDSFHEGTLWRMKWLDKP